METKKYPEGTTKEQWERYYEDLKHHEEYMARTKPIPPPLYFSLYKPTPNYPTHAETQMEAIRIYNVAMSEWKMAYSCDAPNKPGYFRANND